MGRIERTPAIRNFKGGLRFEEDDLEVDSEWAMMLHTFQQAFTPVVVELEPMGTRHRRIAEIDAEGDERVEPNVLPPDDMNSWGGDDWAKELLADDYSRIPRSEPGADKEI